MTITVHYQHYTGTAKYDADAGLYHGEVDNLSDVVTFESETVEGLQRAMAESIEDYLAFEKEART